MRYSWASLACLAISASVTGIFAFPVSGGIDSLASRADQRTSNLVYRDYHETHTANLQGRSSVPPVSGHDLESIRARSTDFSVISPLSTPMTKPRVDVTQAEVPGDDLDGSGSRQVSMEKRNPSPAPESVGQKIKNFFHKVGEGFKKVGMAIGGAVTGALGIPVKSKDPTFNKAHEVTEKYIAPIASAVTGVGGIIRGAVSGVVKGVAKGVEKAVEAKNKITNNNNNNNNNKPPPAPAPKKDDKKKDDKKHKRMVPIYVQW